MAQTSQYLEWHGQQYRVRIKVPADLRTILGKGKLTRPLHTSNLAEANRLKWPAVAELKAAIERARRAATSEDPADALAEALRNDPDEDARAYGIDVHAQRLEAKHGPKRAKAFADLAFGRTTPIDHHADAFLAYKANYRAKSAGDFKRVLGWLVRWLKASHEVLAIEHIDRKLAGRFIEGSLVAGRSRDKAAAYLGFLREYWRWLKMRGYVEENPWLDQTLPPTPRLPRDSEPDRGKRPYTDDEVAKLIHGPAPDYLGDLQRVGALSGMRLEEICQLRVRDCAGGSFAVTVGKTENAMRTVPIHTTLTAIVKRRIKGKEQADFLFDELPDVPISRDTRSDPASKRFTRYRRSVGVDERPNAKAKSNVDFHSFRRWFIKKARDRLEQGEAGYSPWTIADVVGHDDEGVKNVLKLTMAHYPGPSSERAKRAVVDAVRLPK
ncbi:MAG: tyrosine-type recombinase/integrase [Rhizobiaceae bacterium]|nr:tyrosine-type recombinase/integrase [Rhizobiaceae bacterium]